MFGIDLNRPIEYLHSSLRFFDRGERHVTRFCKDDVLLLVFEGVLCFTEDGKDYEIAAGQYHIQRHDTKQSAKKASDAPQYLYVHFRGEWSDGEQTLPPDGTFEYAALKVLMDELNSLAHSDAPHIIQTSKFYEILSQIYKNNPRDSAVYDIADYIVKNCEQDISLSRLSAQFHFSKNHIINLFKKAFSVTPVQYINNARFKKAEFLMEATSEPLEHIAFSCGFQNYSHFYRQFIKRHGISPNDWRKAKRMGT
ncbi:MAG: helix-turn-helix transcriptional regulator [Clostridia bacterium]|nr:helix-turn-helix transcriptional regulator [Clostridia bacterium]